MACSTMGVWSSIEPQGMELLLEQLSAKIISFALLEPIPGTDKTRLFMGERIPAVNESHCCEGTLNLPRLEISE